MKHEGYNSLAGNSAYKYKYQGQELQTETGWYSFKWRNYMPDLGRFFNIDPLAEKYNTWTPYAFSGNRVIDARELEGLEPVEINKTTKNLVIVNQGWIRSNPPDGATQAQNFGKVNKDGGIDYSGIGIINNLNSSTTQVGVFGSSTTENTKNDILASIKSFRKQSPDGKLIMVGHSLGADNEVELVNENPEIKVDLLFTLDIADNYDDDNIPSNVKTAINYYNKNDGFMGSSIGGEDIEVDNPSKTKGVNVPVNASHNQIDNKYRFNAYNAVVKELNKKEDKKP
ncbi:RHS repeat-associated core domain-containing protein [Flavobacterium sp. B17]|uniref:RHS repeat-associated core domain-containing protein n=1 Tax=Flavobacterium sp. B17 TaxID=95618 RepID=UPI001FCB62B1|nr:RHS repeat-associated core domain-containing protein [Flavobacterium sp. B17]